MGAPNHRSELHRVKSLHVRHVGLKQASWASSPASIPPEEGPGTPPSQLQAPPGREDPVEQACSQHLGSSARYRDHHPISHSSPRSPNGGRGSESCAWPHVAPPCWPLGLSSRLWGRSPQSRWERWPGHHRSSEGGPCSHPLPSQPRAGAVQIAPGPQAVGSRRAEGHSRGDGRALGARPPCPGQWGLPPGLRLLDTGCRQRAS